MASRSQPVSRRERPAKPALSRAGIVATARELLESEGLARLTMRRLAQALDTGPASLYVYVRDTDDLHALVLDVLLGDVDPTAIAAGAGEWRDRLWALVGAYAAVLREQPALARVALVTRLSGPCYLAIVDAALGLLDEGGATRGQAAWAVDLLLLTATASAVEQGTRRSMPDAGQQHDTLAARVAEASPEHHPHIAAGARALLAGSGGERSRWAFDVLVSGALVTPMPTTTP